MEGYPTISELIECFRIELRENRECNTVVKLLDVEYKLVDITNSMISISSRCDIYRGNRHYFRKYFCDVDNESINVINKLKIINKTKIENKITLNKQYIKNNLYRHSCDFDKKSHFQPKIELKSPYSINLDLSNEKSMPNDKKFPSCAIDDWSSWGGYIGHSTDWG